MNALKIPIPRPHPSLSFKERGRGEFLTVLNIQISSSSPPLFPSKRGGRG